MSTQHPTAPEPSQKRVGRTGWAIIVRFGLFTLALSLGLSFLVLPWLRLSWWMAFRRCVSIAAAISLWLSIKHYQGRTLRSYGFSNFGVGKRQFLFGLLLGLGALVFLLLVGVACGVYRFEVTLDHIRLWRTVIGFIPAVVLIGILEELVFRGILLQPLLDMSRPVAIIISSILYALVHVKTGLWTPSIWLELGGLFLLGVILALSYVLTNQLYLAVGLHAALAYGARVNKLIVKISDQSLTWLVGTSRLVNGLMSWMMLLGILGIVVWWARMTCRGGVRYEQS